MIERYETRHTYNGIIIKPSVIGEYCKFSDIGHIIDENRLMKDWLVKYLKFGDDVCPCCGIVRFAGHSDNCELAKLIGE